VISERAIGDTDNQATDWGLLTPLRNEFFLPAENCIAESLDMAISSIRCGELPIDRSLPCHKTQLANVACPLLLSSVIEVSPWCKQCRFSELSILLARRGIGSRRLSDYEFI